MLKIKQNLYFRVVHITPSVYNFFFSCRYFEIFGIQNPWIGIQPKMLDPDPYQMNADPQPWLKTIQINLIKSPLTGTMCVVLYGTYYVCGRRRIYSRLESNF